MQGDKASLSWSVKITGVFMVVASLVGIALVIFVIPGNNYLSGALFLMLSMVFVVGLLALAVGLFITYRRLLARSIALPAILIMRLIGRG